MHRFYVEPSAAKGRTITLSEREAHHAKKALRLREGERVSVLDGAGTEMLCQIETMGKHDVTLNVYQRNVIPPLPYRITLIQAVPKGKAMETIVQKATELGAHRIVPLLSERTVPQIEDETAEAKVEKWRWVAIDAIKQCGSAWLPEIDLPVKPGQFLARQERFELPLIASLQPDARHPRQYFGDFIEERKAKPKTVCIWIGPEGDFTPAELNAAKTAGASPITLGPLVLRSDTAAIYCLSILNYELQAN